MLTALINIQRITVRNCADLMERKKNNEFRFVKPFGSPYAHTGRKQYANTMEKSPTHIAHTDTTSSVHSHQIHSLFAIFRFTQYTQTAYLYLNDVNVYLQNE